MSKVIVSAEQVEIFRRSWPCCTLAGPITFEYDSQGDLVDIQPMQDCEDLDYNEENDRALLALSYDAAKGYGRLEVAK